MSKIYSLILLLLCSTILGFTAKSQCSTCNITNPSGSVTLNGVVCFTQDCTLGDVTLGDDVTFCITEGKTVTIQNNITSTIGNKLKIIISKNSVLYINQPLTLNADLDIIINKDGTLKVGGTNYNSDLKLEGNKLNINNNGTFTSANIEINSNSSNNDIVSTGKMNINGNMNISHGWTLFQNQGSINIGQNYSGNANTKFVNCGTMISAYGFNLGGGIISNTGTFTNASGNIDLSTGKVYNYGTFTSKDQWGGQAGSNIYNEGVINLKNYSIGNTIEGPKDASKKGYFYVQQQMLTNSIKIGPNLDFTMVNNDGSVATSQGATQVFNAPSSVSYIDQNGTSTTASMAGVTFHCMSGCPTPVTNINSCPEPETPIVTPVELTKFIGLNINSLNRLYWTTSSEINFKYFDIERFDSNSWRSLGEVGAMGSNSKGYDYSFTDYTPLLGNNLYKLKMVDIDGTSDYSETINIVNNTSTKSNISLYPNPAKSTINIANLEPGTKISIFSISGQLQQSLISSANPQNIKIENLTSGVYIIKIVSSNLVQQFKFIKN